MVKRRSKGLKGGGCGGAADYGVYVWGVNQTAGQEGNLIQPNHDPRLFGQPVVTPQPASVSGGGKKIKGGNISSTISPSLYDSSMDQSKINEMVNSKMSEMIKPVLPNSIITTDSAESTMNVKGGKNKRISKKKIYTKNKRHTNGRRKRRTSKIR
jgi:hypothetical protein